MRTGDADRRFLTRALVALAAGVALVMVGLVLDPTVALLKRLG